MRNSEFDFVVIGGGIIGSVAASSLATRGARVALIDRGSASLAGMAPPRPEIHFSDRRHVGCKEARNHVLGGNGHFWGGGLIRPPNMDVLECLGIQESTSDGPPEDLSATFARIERKAGIRNSPNRTRFSVKDPRIGSCCLAEMCVLPGRSRNISRPALHRLVSATGSEILSQSEIIDFVPVRGESEISTISSVDVRCEGATRSLTGTKFIIAAGAIDSNILVLGYADQLGLAGRLDEIGSAMHDHLSLPIARVRLSRQQGLRDLLAPRFHRGTVIGRRFELACDHGWGAQGFLHFQFLFDDISPYREIKNVLALRQQAASALDLVKAAIPLLAEAPELIRIGVERVFKERLYLSDRLLVVATLDFETCPRADQRLRLTDNRVEFSWKVTKDDEETFMELSKKAKHLLSELADTYGMQFECLNDFADAEATRTYLHENATDAFHLGGGLRASTTSDGLVNDRLRLVGTDNVYVISSAVFRRPGVVNPTHTLLALADRFVASEST